MSQRGFVQGTRIRCAACSADLAGIWAPSGKEAGYLPDVRGYLRDGDVYKITRRALERARQGKRPGYRRDVPAQIPITEPYWMECWSCGLVQELPSLPSQRPLT